ncbi:hypothetical protein TNCV_203411 [Trichonephila clavipes]|nr:hypothetical protein TNCV_203411 [Trichonephila clavipes]
MRVMSSSLVPLKIRPTMQRLKRHSIGEVWIRSGGGKSRTSTTRSSGHFMLILIVIQEMAENQTIGIECSGSLTVVSQPSDCSLAMFSRKCRQRPILSNLE